MILEVIDSRNGGGVLQTSHHFYSVKFFSPCPQNKELFIVNKNENCSKSVCFLNLEGSKQDEEHAFV